MQSRTRTVLVIVLSAVVVVAVVGVFVFASRPAKVTATPHSSATPSTSTTPAPPVVTPSQTPTPAPTTPAAFDKTAHSLTNPASDWVLVNKKHPLNPRAYAPPLQTLNLPGRYGQMRPEAAAALRKMFAAYHAHSGAQLSVVSPYRSYSSQVAVYNGWVARLGKAQADRQSARPGFSEHQTGLAVDIDTAIDQGFGKTPAGKWLAANSWKFGFIVRYQEGQEKITGYEYEPWHFRYVGVPLATELHVTGTKSLEAFFGYPDAPTY